MPLSLHFTVFLLNKVQSAIVPPEPHPVNCQTIMSVCMLFLLHVISLWVTQKPLYSVTSQLILTPENGVAQGVSVSIYRVIQKEVYTFKNLFYKYY
jgi:hypothetical protein